MEKKTIIFVCHGSICRSPAAEFIFKSKLNKLGRSTEYEVISRALTYEEIGNDIYPPMKRELLKQGVSFSMHSATILTKNDAEQAYLIIYMDEENKYHLSKFQEYSNKIIPIYKYSKEINEIEDPWYTGNYEKVVKQISKCCDDLLSLL